MENNEIFENFKNDFCRKNKNLYVIYAQEMKSIPEISKGTIDVHKEHSRSSDGEFDGYRFRVDNQEIQIENFEDVESYLADFGYELYSRMYPNYTFVNYGIKNEFDKVVKETQEYNNNILSARKKLIKLLKEEMSDIFENTYVRFGKIPADEKSFNFREKIKENGVSCFSAVKINGQYVIDVAGGMFTYFGYVGKKQAYEIAGQKVDEDGSDGEPLLNNVRIVKKINAENLCTIEDFVHTVFDEK